MTNQRLLICLFTVCGWSSAASAQSSLACPTTSTTTSFQGSAMQTDCAGSVTQSCTTKAGTAYNPTTSSIILPSTSGNFQAPPGAAVPQNVFFAAPGDFDKDGWDDFVAADDTDKIYIMRNQTITCDTTSCSGTPSTAPTVQTIPLTWWNTLTNVRPAAFQPTTDTSGTDQPLKPSPGVPYGMRTPLAAGDFDGDGWPDFAAISITSCSSGGGGYVCWPTAARLFLNTKNCHDAANIPCGIGNLCAGQPSNGACSGSGVAGSGTPWAETQLSCTDTLTCPFYEPTFATYDLRTGTPVSSIGTTSSTSPTTSKPGDFGPIGHSVQNTFVVDWDGDGDLDIIYGHSTGTCPGSLCTTAGAVFYAGIDVWKNDCAQSAQWNAVTKSCVGHIPVFSHSSSGTCTGTSCNNSDVLMPSTAHNSSTLAPSDNLGFDVPTKELPAFAYVDIDKDGDLDLILGSPGCCSSSSNADKRLRIFKGTTNSPTSHMLDTTNPLILSTSDGTYPGFQGGLTGIFAFDFSNDGWPDIVTGSDSFAYDGTNGGRTRYFKNNANSSNPFGSSTWPGCATTPASCAGCSSTCNPNATANLSESCGFNTCIADLTVSPPQFPDFDMGLMLNYDHDPQNTQDIVFTNGDTSAEFYIFPNRATAAGIAACGTVASGTLPISTSELTISGVCIAPTSTTPANTSITYYLNNESPANWQLACTQTPAGYAPPLNASGQCCVTLPNITGRTVQWKAVVDSNTTDGPGICTATGTVSPTITSVAASYVYTQSANHYKAGVVVSDGVSYVGSFTQPGNRGHLYATAAALNTTYYDFGTKLDALATRYVYTSNVTGATGVSRINFDPNSPSSVLQARVGAASAAEATSIINWVLSPRFGINNSGTPPTKLGAVLDSTPAILNKPYRPNWYSFLPSSDKSLYDTFATSQASRVPLLLFASMDGMLHAVMTIPTLISDSHNGQEAWAFIPPFVASNMKSDYTASCTPSCAAGSLAITSYPDGSPTLLDYKKSGGAIATVAIVGDGAGGTSVSALDVTSTVTPGSYATTGPTPMWSWQSGGAVAGKAVSKVGVARALIAGVEKFVVVTGSGLLSSDLSKGKIISGFNLETGALLWQFEMQCALTSDITVFETDDTGEPGNPQIDGYADRAVFADNCGNVYKINPGQDLAGGYMDNTGYGPIAIGLSNGKNRYALFSTSQVGAVGAARPIANVIGAQTDNTTDMVLFFGTGGLDSFDVTQVNEFYAVYAKNGVIRNKIAGSCTSATPRRCEKFYGGVVLTPDTVILSKSTDALIGGVGQCDFGSTHLLFRSLNTLASIQDISSILGVAIAAVSGPIYGDAGAIYFATVSGEVKRIGQPRAATAGADTTAGTLNGMGATQLTGANAGFTLMGWRVVL